jgi:ankyrin repeat protein
MKLRRFLPLLLPVLLLASAAHAQQPPPPTQQPPPQTPSPSAEKQQLNEQLYEAVRKGDAAEVKSLLDRGADVNAKFRYGATALFKAAEKGNADVVKLLLECGADTTVRDTFYGATAMTWALDKEHVEAVRALLAKSPEGAAGEVLLAGTRGGNAALVKAALERGGIKPEALTGALASASANAERAEIAELLKKAGAVPPPEVDAATLESYVGRYKGTQGPEIVFSVKGGRLIATATGQPPLPMFAIDKTTFKPTDFDGITIVFNNAEAGKVNGFTLKQGPATIAYTRAEQQ